MDKFLKTLRNRDFLLIFSIVLGLAWGDGAKVAEKAVLPVLALVMTLSVMGVPGDVFRSPRSLIVPVLIGLLLNYGLLGGLLLGLNYAFIRDDYLRAGGGRLLVLTGLGPDGQLRQLMPQPPLHGSFWRPDVSYDGRKVLFCYKPHNEKSFHLYEINADGTGLVQVTDGPFDDFDPIYLPDEKHVVFSTTRGHTYVRCMPPTSSFVLARCERDGRNMYFISANNEPDYLPSVLHDGRIVYTRWEYTDKPLWRAEKLWTVHPDGTQVTML